MIGYVRTNYTHRPINNALADVKTWTTNWGGFNGIFFDETPNSYTSAIGTYLQKIDANVKSSSFNGVNFVSFPNFCG